MTSPENPSEPSEANKAGDVPKERSSSRSGSGSGNRVRRKKVSYEVKTWLPGGKKLRRILAVLVLVGFVGLAIGYWKRAAIRQFGNEWNAERHYAKAVQELEAGSPKVAVRRAMTSIQLDPERIETLRFLLKAAREAGDSRILIFGAVLYQHPESTEEDKIEALGGINDVGDAFRFEAFFEALPETAKTNPDARYEWYRHLLIKGATDQVISELAGQESPDSDRRLQLLLLDALRQSGSAENDARANALVMRLIENGTDSDEYDEVWSRLASVPSERIEQTQGQKLLELYRKLPPSEEVDASLPYSLQIASNPVRRSLFVQEAIGALQERELDDLCLWLMRLGESDAILEFVDEIVAYRSDFAYEARVRALIDVGQLEDAFSLLQFPPQLADRMGVLILKASVAKALDRKSDETGAWQEALLEAERDMTENRYLKLARFAQAAGELDVAADALVAACRHPRGVMPPSQEISWLTRYLIEKDRPNELLTVTRRLAQGEGSNPELINNGIYLSLILGDEKIEVNERVIAMAEDLVERYPQTDGIRTTLALARLRAGQPAEALGTFTYDQREGVGWQRFNDADRAIFAMALKENGREAMARNVTELIRWDRMLDVEKKFFRDSLRDLMPAEMVSALEPKALSPEDNERLKDLENRPDIAPEETERMKMLENREIESGSVGGEQSERMRLLEERKQREAAAAAESESAGNP